MLTNGYGIFKINLDDWAGKETINYYDLTCYFCGRENESWDARVKRIGAHFEQGYGMDRWAGNIESVIVR